jgi:hypothetical protein
MYPLVLKAFILVALTVALPDQAGAQAGVSDALELDLLGALRASRVAEIYVIDRGVAFPTTPTPDAVREVGCKYLVRRRTPNGRELAQSLSEANIHFRPTSFEGAVRIGLVLSDDRGTTLEIYANDGPWPDGRLTGFTQRRPVEISPGFATALLGFVERHPDLVSNSRPELCPRAARGAP